MDGLGRVSRTAPLVAASTMDAKVLTADMANRMMVWAAIGRPNQREWLPGGRHNYVNNDGLYPSGYYLLEAGAALRGLEPGPLVVAALLCAVVAVLWAVRSADLLAAAGRPVGVLPLVPMTTFANTINNLTPGSAGEIVRMYLLRAHHGVDYATSGAVVLVERIGAFGYLATSALLAWLAWLAHSLETSTELTNIMQGVDSATSLLIVLGGGAFYLSTFEGRWRRDRAMKGLHELRSIIHVIDMHQLTKDPSAFGAPRTSSSPDRSMTPHQLLRYLGYCSELLSLASKVAALYADKLHDPAIVEAVGDIERLTSNLSKKIWQKIELVQERMPARPAVDALAPKIS